MSPRQLVLTAATVCVALGLIAGFATIGSPEHARAVAVDSVRISEIMEIRAWFSQSYHDPDRKLPATLPRAATRSLELDPSGASYSYERLQGKRYHLCATFAGPTPSDIDDRRSTMVPPGRRCYTFDAAAPQQTSRPGR